MATLALDVIMLFIVCNNVIILTKGYDKLEECDDSRSTFKISTAQIPETPKVLISKHRVQEIVCTNCTETIIRKKNRSSKNILSYHFDMMRNFDINEVPFINIGMHPDGQTHQEQIVFRISLTDKLTSTLLCVMTSWKGMLKPCDVNLKIPIVDQEMKNAKLSYIISIDSLENQLYFTTMMKEKSQLNYQSKFNFSLVSNKVSFFAMHTIAESIQVSSIDRRLHKRTIKYVSSRYPKIIENCTDQTPFCKSLPRCLNIDRSCNYKESHSTSPNLNYKNNERSGGFRKDGETKPILFTYNVKRTYGLKMIKIDLVGKSGRLRFLTKNGQNIDSIRIKNNTNQNQFDIYLNPTNDLDSNNFAIFRISNSCPIFSILLLLPYNSSCSDNLEAPKIVMVLEQKVTLIGLMRYKFDTLSSIEIEGDMKVLSTKESFNEEKCKNIQSTSITVVIIASIIIIFIIVVPVTLFARRIRKDSKKKMLFMINSNISHHADKEYNRAKEKPSREPEREDQEIVFESVEENVYYEQCEEYTPPRIIYRNSKKINIEN